MAALRAAGTRVSRLTVIGGGSRSAYWGSLIAAALELPLDFVQGGEVGPALGAARLAQIAVDGGAPTDICRRPPVAHSIDPDRNIIARLAEKKQLFGRAYSPIASLRVPSD